jgi:flagellar biosynthesis/type III secretory pathway protein FliH
MPYITSVERIGQEEGLRRGLEQGRKEGIEQGRQEGLLDGIALALKLKFGPAGQAIIPEVRALTDLRVIREVYARIETATTIDEIRQTYA